MLRTIAYCSGSLSRSGVFQPSTEGSQGAILFVIIHIYTDETFLLDLYYARWHNHRVPREMATCIVTMPYTLPGDWPARPLGPGFTKPIQLNLHLCRVADRPDIVW